MKRRQILKLLLASPAASLIAPFESAIAQPDKTLPPAPDWAFCMDGAYLVTGALFGAGSWPDESLFPPRSVMLEHELGWGACYPNWRRLRLEEASESASRSRVYVAMVNPGDREGFLAAASSCAQIAREGVLTLLLCARPHPGLCIKNGVPLAAAQPGGPIGRIVDAWPASANHACAMLAMHSRDPYCQLVGIAASFSNLWRALFDRDLTAVRKVIGCGRLGWYAWGVAYGERRAALAANDAMKELRLLSADLGRTAGALVTITTSENVSLDEFGTVTAAVRSGGLPDDAQTVFVNDVRLRHDPCLSVEVFLTTKGEDRAHAG